MKNNKNNKTDKIKKETTISGAQVELYLQNNPNFFIKRQDLLSSLQLNKGVSNSVADFTAYQIKYLQNKAQELQTQNTHLHQVLRNNEKINTHTQHIMLDIQETTNLTELTEIFVTAWLDDFNLIANILCTQNKTILKALDNLFENTKHQAIYCDKITAVESSALFNGQAMAKSAIVSRLSYAKNTVFVALGSENKNHFTPELNLESYNFMRLALQYKLSNFIEKE